ncbi:MAG TPA: hypothetical protein DHU79_05970 [Clostridiales bacterium]|nr:hypothetical protein [Clostridiales bacterium]
MEKLRKAKTPKCNRKWRNNAQLRLFNNKKCNKSLVRNKIRTGLFCSSVPGDDNTDDKTSNATTTVIVCVAVAAVVVAAAAIVFVFLRGRKAKR